MKKIQYGNILFTVKDTSVLEEIKNTAPEGVGIFEEFIQIGDDFLRFTKSKEGHLIYGVWDKELMRRQTYQNLKKYQWRTIPMRIQRQLLEEGKFYKAELKRIDGRPMLYIFRKGNIPLIYKTSTEREEGKKFVVLMKQRISIRRRDST